MLHKPVASKAYLNVWRPVVSSTDWLNNTACAPSEVVITGATAKSSFAGATINVTSAYFNVANDNLPWLFNFKPFVVVIVSPARFVTVYSLPNALYAELLTSNISMFKAPSSAVISLSDVYHSIWVHVGDVGLHVTVFSTPLPSHAVTVNVTSPAAINLTLPVYSSIVATSVFEEDHLTEPFVTPLGVTAALNVTGTPTISRGEDTEIVKSSTALYSIDVSLTTTIFVI